MYKRLLVFLAVMTVGITLHAQDNTAVQGISFRALFMDYQSQNGGSLTTFKDYDYGFEIGYYRSLQSNLKLVVPFRYGAVTSHVNIDEESFNRVFKKVYSLDAQIQYQLVKENANVTPYIMAGLGGVGESEGEFNLQVPLGLGMHFKLNNNNYINIQSEYRLSFSEDRNNLVHGVGFVHYLGPDIMDDKKEEEVIEDILDSDMDGIIDEVDLCPNAYGPKELNGCPDSDGDGIADYLDECPDLAGLSSFRGCPDTDGDGLSDNNDECPKVAGPASNKGCPGGDRDNDGVADEEDDCPDLAGLASNRGCPGGADADGDGVLDSDDLCPNQKGTAATKGCPDNDGDGIANKDDKCPNKFGPAVYAGCPDTDGDGLDDGRDRCPNTAGPVSTGGCPEIKAEDKKTLDIAMRAVEFDTGRATIKGSSNRIMMQVLDILNRYPDYHLVINGHTDNTGKASANQALSERRAKACYDFLVNKGVSSYRLKYQGFGESRPVADNNTLKGRSLNRRVEFNLVPGR